MLKLTIFQNNKILKKYPVTSNEIVTIGSHKSSHIRIPVSGFKGILIPESENCIYYQDIQSTPKTLINGKALYHKRLVENDIIEWEKYKLVLSKDRYKTEKSISLYDEKNYYYLPINLPSEATLEKAATQESLDFLYRCGRLLLENDAAEELLQTLLEWIKEYFCASRIIVGTFDEYDELVCLVRIAPPDFSLSRTMIDRMLTTGKCVYSNNAMEDPNFISNGKIPHSISAEIIRSAILAPLHSNDKISGVLYCDRNPAEAFTNIDLYLFNMLADYVGDYINNNYIITKDQTLYNYGGFDETYLTNHKKMKDMIKKVKAALPYDDMNILLLGESGVGKDRFAEMIHSLSKRYKKKFISVNCASIPETLFESELFGSVRGAYTGAVDRKGLFEQADGGTLFLNEIGELPQNLQAKLLTTIEKNTIQRVGSEKNKSINFKLITATNKDLVKEVKAGTFRKDLYYRLKYGIEIKIPPLRKRPEDIALLLGYLLYIERNTNKEKVARFSDKAIEKLLKYTWPGNIREFGNIIRKAIIFSNTTTINEKQIDFGMDEGINILSLSEMERDHIYKTLLFTNFNIEKSSRLLGIVKQTLYKKMESYNIERPV